MASSLAALHVELATATVDRLLHHAHVAVTNDDSFRLAEATTGKGVTPLN